MPDSRNARVIIDLLAITLLAVVVFRKYIFTNEWPAGGDVLGWISRAYLFGNDFLSLYIWRPHSFGFVEGVNSMDLFLTAIYFICKDPATTIKIFMFCSFSVAGFTMYAFAYYYNHRHTPALSASLIYCLNPWIFSQLTEAHVDILFSYALIPLIFLFLDTALERRGFKDLLRLALSLALFTTGFHPESIVIYGSFVLIFILFFSLVPIKTGAFRTRLKHLSAVVLSAAVVCFLLSAFSFLPLISNARAPYYSPAFGYPIDDAEKHSYANVVDAFTLRAVESWGYMLLVNVYSDLSLPGFPVDALQLLIYALAFFTVFFRRDRYTVFFAFSIAISTFIAKGPHPPLGEVFTWMWFNIPFFAVFRAASRAAMMTALSHAFLVSVLANTLIGHMHRVQRAEKEDLYLKVNVKGADENVAHHMFVSIEVLTKAVRGLCKFLRCLILLLLFLVFITGFLSCFYFFSHGLQVYTPPEKYIEPYEWLAVQSGDYKVITVSNSPSEWMAEKQKVSDFAFNGMLTGIGWAHDIGFDSPFIHGKPTLQDGGWNPSSRTFVDYLRFHLAREHSTDDLLRILGPFNYKYVVLPVYLDKDTRNFFLHQQGYHIVYDRGSTILQNEYYIPKFFSPSQYVYVVGGLDSLASLHGIRTFNLNQTALLFLHQTGEASSLASGMSYSSDALVFANSDIVDAVMLSLRNQTTFIEAAGYGALSLDSTKYWVRDNSWRCTDGLVYGGETLTTKGNNSLKIPFKVDSDGIYDVWMRIGFADFRGKLNVLIDENRVGVIQPLSSSRSRLMWVKMTSLDLGHGAHTIGFANDGAGYNDLDAIAILKPDVFESTMNDVISALQRFSGRIIYVLGAENTFGFNLPENWNVAHMTYEGYVLHTEKQFNAAPIGNASASSFGVWDTISLKAEGATDRKRGPDYMQEIRWASKPHETVPQWLQIDWAVPQEIAGVGIFFERAHAVDYKIQTWNGTNWVDQVSVTGNSMLEKYHSFPAVNTTRLRIYVTSVTKLYDLVSIWELEVYKPQGISTEISFPREGYYMFALRLASGPDYGTISLRVDECSDSRDCFSLNREFGWKYFGPILLSADSHKIEVIGTGKIDFDQMIVYSLTEGEEGIEDRLARTPFVDDLFKTRRTPTIKYERMNPCKYIVHVENDGGPFLLIFSESYHPMWKALLDGAEIAPVLAYSMVNGFYINKTGSFDIIVYFTGQTYADIGLGISIATLIIVMTMIAIPTEKSGKWMKHIKQVLNIHRISPFGTRLFREGMRALKQMLERTASKNPSTSRKVHRYSKRPVLFPSASVCPELEEGAYH